MGLALLFSVDSSQYRHSKTHYFANAATLESGVIVRQPTIPMKMKETRFSVPFCIFAEPMPAKARVLLVYLFGQSDFGGVCRPGYSEMQRAIRDKPSENGSRTTVRRWLGYLEKQGWIFHMKRTNGNMAIWLQVPPRYRSRERAKKDVVVPISVVQ